YSEPSRESVSKRNHHAASGASAGYRHHHLAYRARGVSDGPFHRSKRQPRANSPGSALRVEDTARCFVCSQGENAAGTAEAGGGEAIGSASALALPVPARGPAA